MTQIFIKLNILILFFYSSIHAEDFGQYAFKFGGGISSPAFSGVEGLFDEDEYLNRPGVNFGIQIRLFQSNQLALFGEVQYQARGSELELFYTDDNGSRIKIQKLDNLYEYIVFSGAGNFTFGNSGLRPFLKAAPTLSLLLRERSTFGSLNFDTKRFVFGIELGGGLVFAKLPPGELFLEVQYDLDLTNALATDANLPVQFSLKHRVVSVSLGMLLP